MKLIKYASIIPFCSCCFAGLILAQSSLLGQSTTRLERDGEKTNGLQVEAAFKPAFFCKPAVNKIEARKGQNIEFEFRLEPVREAVRVSVRPVVLRQFENGGLKADLESPPPPEVRLEGSGEYDLQLGSELVLRGRIKLPNNDSDFHSFGILVRDNGYLSDKRAKSDESTFGVKFVSQYILRCDVTITNGRGSDIKNLQIESAELLERNGLPTAQIMVYNPTDSTVEFEMQSRLLRPGYVESKRSVKLFSPINSNDIPEEKYTTRIFPKTRLKMVSDWPDAVFAGHCEMETKIMRKRKTFLVTNTPLEIGADDFPAQSTFAAEVANGVQVHPSQVYLSRQRGSKRFVPLSFTNFSTNDVDLGISVVTNEGDVAKWVLVRPERLSMRPGEKRKAMISLKALKDHESHRLAYVQFTDANSVSGEVKKLPVVFQGSRKFVPVIATNALRVDQEIEGGAFVVDVLNQSELPLPIDAYVEFKSSNGNNQNVKAGYGKWLMPGEKRRLQFDIDVAVSEGDLPVSLTFLDTQQKVMAQRDFVLKIEKAFEEVAEIIGQIKK